MSDATNNTPMMNKDLYSRMLHVLQNYSITPGVKEIALVTRIDWRTLKGGTNVCDVRVSNLRINESFWIRELPCTEEMQHSAAIGDIIAYHWNKDNDEVRITRNFDAEGRFNAGKKAFTDFFSRSSK